jgi:hypothetical protein
MKKCDEETWGCEVVVGLNSWSWMSWCEVSVALNTGLLDDESTTTLLHPGFPNPHWDDRKRVFWK